MTGAVLITGGAGYIGSHTAKALHRAGRTPVTFDDLSSGQESAVRWGPLVRGDIRDADAVRAAIRQHRPSLVMHFAARVEVGEAEQAPSAFYDVNVGGTVNLVRVMLEEGVDQLVFSSSCAVHGDPERLPLTEDQPKRPVGVYGRTKLMAEQMLEDVSRAEGLRVAMLRYFNAAGADPEGEIGERHDLDTHLIPIAMKAAAGLAPPLKLFGADYPTRDGSCMRDYVHVCDLADAHVLAADRLDGGGPSVQLNLGAGEGHTVFEVLAAIKRVTGRAVPHTIAPRRLGDAVSLIADTTSSRKELGWKPSRSDLDTIVATAWAFLGRRWKVA